MGRIKSALEIALERTESVKSDKDSIGQFEAKQQGKKIANEFLEDPSRSLEESLKKAPKEQRESLKQGIFEVLLSQIALPLTRDDEKRIQAVGRGLGAVISDGHFPGRYKQFTQIIARYLDDADQYDKAIRRQYEPKLRAKEEELSRRYGRQVQLDPFQDPEFVTFYNQNMSALKQNYQGAVDQIREEAGRCFDGS
ncbi:MAG: hypothetical protein LBP20_11430 [Treponema sp.]|jgi:hypothetical protein|nr:hypothetical protein [Treponema sp.]